MLDACPADKKQDRQMRLFSDARQTGSRFAKQERSYAPVLVQSPQSNTKNLKAEERCQKLLPQKT